jgi:hypothetical protein
MQQLRAGGPSGHLHGNEADRVRVGHHAHRSISTPRTATGRRLAVGLFTVRGPREDSVNPAGCANACCVVVARSPDDVGVVDIMLNEQQITRCAGRRGVPRRGDGEIRPPRVGGGAPDTRPGADVGARVELARGADRARAGLARRSGRRRTGTPSVRDSETPAVRGAIPRDSRRVRDGAAGGIARDRPPRPGSWCVIAAAGGSCFRMRRRAERQRAGLRRLRTPWRGTRCESRRRRDRGLLRSAPARGPVERVGGRHALAQLLLALDLGVELCAEQQRDVR